MLLSRLLNEILGFGVSGRRMSVVAMYYHRGLCKKYLGAYGGS